MQDLERVLTSGSAQVQLVWGKLLAVVTVSRSHGCHFAVQVLLAYSLLWQHWAVQACDSCEQYFMSREAGRIRVQLGAESVNALTALCTYDRRM